MTLWTPRRSVLSPGQLRIREGEALAAFDRAVDRGFDVLRGNPVADRVFYGASALGDHSLIWAMLAALRGLRSDDDWHAAARAGVTLLAESLLVNVGIKSLFRRHRPIVETPRPLPLRMPRTSSFPSGHATAAFCAAALLSEDDPLAPVYYFLAVIVASSRVYVRIHHASDIVVGAAFGALVGRMVRKLHPLPVRPVGNA